MYSAIKPDSSLRGIIPYDRTTQCISADVYAVFSGTDGITFIVNGQSRQVNLPEAELEQLIMDIANDSIHLFKKTGCDARGLVDAYIAERLWPEIKESAKRIGTLLGQEPDLKGYNIKLNISNS